jgi:hypothetical protein
MNYMLNLAYEKSTWYQSIGLERTHCTSFFHKKKEKRHCCCTRKLGLFIEEDFQPQNHLEKCALTQGTLWHLQRTFSVGRSPGK